MQCNQKRQNKFVTLCLPSPNMSHLNEDPSLPKKYNRHLQFYIYLSIIISNDIHYISIKHTWYLKYPK